MALLIGLLATFAVLLIVFHLVLLRLPISRAAWEATDYIWFGVTVLSLVGVAAQLRNGSLLERLARLDADVDLVQDVLVDAARSAATRYAPEGVAATTQAADAADWFHQISAAALKNETRLLRRVVATQPAPPAAPGTPLHDDERRVLDQLEQLAKLDAQVEELTAATQRSWPEKAVVAAYPWLLAAVLALRLTRTTAVVRMMREPASPT